MKKIQKIKCKIYYTTELCDVTTILMSFKSIMHLENAFYIWCTNLLESFKSLLNDLAFFQVHAFVYSQGCIKAIFLQHNQNILIFQTLIKINQYFHKNLVRTKCCKKNTFSSIQDSTMLASLFS
jgi:hypothetical protein